MCRQEKYVPLHNNQQHLGKMKTAVIYARVSSVGDRQNTERQVKDLQAYAQKESISVIQIFEEHISGAKKNTERPILSECLEFCVQNKINLILCSELSRLGRSVFEVLENVKFCIDNKINIFFQKENLSIFNDDGSENPYTAIMIAVLGTAAQLERENIKFRLNSGRAQYIAKHGHKGLGRPRGTIKDHDTLAAEYKQVIKELKRGTSIRRTAKLCGVSNFTVQKIKKEFSI